MSQKRILVTGATGKVGRTFIRRILASDDHRDYRIRAMCHNRLLEPSDRLHWYLTTPSGRPWHGHPGLCAGPRRVGRGRLRDLRRAARDGA